VTWRGYRTPLPCGHSDGATHARREGQRRKDPGPPVAAPQLVGHWRVPPKPLSVDYWDDWYASKAATPTVGEVMNRHLGLPPDLLAGRSRRWRMRSRSSAGHEPDGTITLASPSRGSARLTRCRRGELISRPTPSLPLVAQSRLRTGLRTGSPSEQEF
jgi:hypothetical protein